MSDELGPFVSFPKELYFYWMNFVPEYILLLKQLNKSWLRICQQYEEYFFSKDKNFLQSIKFKHNAMRLMDFFHHPKRFIFSFPVVNCNEMLKHIIMYGNVKIFQFFTSGNHIKVRYRDIGTGLKKNEITVFSQSLTEKFETIVENAFHKILLSKNTENHEIIRYIIETPCIFYNRINWQKLSSNAAQLHSFWITKLIFEKRKIFGYHIFTEMGKMNDQEFFLSIKNEMRESEFIELLSGIYEKNNSVFLKLVLFHFPTIYGLGTEHIDIIVRNNAVQCIDYLYHSGIWIDKLSLVKSIMSFGDRDMLTWMQKEFPEFEILTENNLAIALSELNCNVIEWFHKKNYPLPRNIWDEIETQFFSLEKSAKKVLEFLKSIRFPYDEKWIFGKYVLTSHQNLWVERVLQFLDVLASDPHPFPFFPELIHYLLKIRDDDKKSDLFRWNGAILSKLLLDMKIQLSSDSDMTLLQKYYPIISSKYSAMNNHSKQNKKQKIS